MRVSATVKFGSGGDGSGQKANIKRQIRKLEEKRDEYMKKLAKLGKQQKEALDSVELGKGSVSSGSSAPASQMNITESFSASVQGEEGFRIQEASSKEASRIQMVSSLLSGEGASGSSSSGEFEITMTAEELMEMIEVLNIQITMLMQQLDDGSTMEMGLVDDDDDEDEGGSQAAQPSETNNAAPALPEASVDIEGHVDGYA